MGLPDGDTRDPHGQIRAAIATLRALAEKPAADHFADVGKMMAREQAVELYERERKFETALDDPDAAAIRAILAAHRQGAAQGIEASDGAEPVAWRAQSAHGIVYSGAPGGMGLTWTPLYAAPPRPLVPLTAEQAESLLEKFAGGAEWTDDEHVAALALLRDTEAAHGIGTQGEKT
jgi:hypothetical protein